MIIVIAAFREVFRNANNKEEIRMYNKAFMVENWDAVDVLSAKLKREAHSISSSKIESLEMEFN